ncbi:MAG: hypothetical protein H6582_00230 [Crocinitomicaceae bacterium]|nr:hypothetical protein [Crocinitomicaceae bacterium]
MSVIENLEQYQVNFCNKAKAELDSRELGVEELMEIAKPIYREKVRNLFNETAFSFIKVPLPHSSFLIESEKEKIYMEEVHHWKMYKMAAINGTPGLF